MLSASEIYYDMNSTATGFNDRSALPELREQPFTLHLSTNNPITLIRLQAALREL
jgi:hypothetical protein